MKAEVEKLEKNKVKLNIEVPKEKIDKAISLAYKSISKKVSIPGFRQGKVPKKVIDSHLGKEVVYSEMLQGSIPDFYNEAVEVSGIEPVTQPEFEVEVENVSENKPFNFSASVEVKPEVKLGEYKDLEIKKPTSRITKKSIDKAIDELRERFSALDVVDKKIEIGDYVLIDFQGYQDGKKLKEGADAQDYLAEVGSEVLLPDFEKNLIGQKKGDEVEFTVKIPKTHYMKEIAGKKVDFKVTIKEVKSKTLPEKNDDFAKEVGEYESYSDLEKKVKENLKKKLERDSDQAFQNEVLQKVVDQAELEIPEKLVENRVSTMMNQFSQNLHKQGISLDEYLEVTNSSVEKIQGEFKKDAKSQIKSALVLEQIAKEEKVEVTPEDLDKEFEKSAQQLNYSKERLMEMAVQQGDIESLKNRILANKVIDFLLEKNKKKKSTKKTSAKKEEKKTAEKEAKPKMEKKEIIEEKNIKTEDKKDIEEKKEQEIMEANESEGNA